MSHLIGADPFDIHFVDMMIPHHQGAITMSQVLFARGVSAAARQLAEQIMVAQTREIQQMREFRASVTGSPAPAPGDGGEGHPHLASVDTGAAPGSHHVRVQRIYRDRSLSMRPDAETAARQDEDKNEPRFDADTDPVPAGVDGKLDVEPGPGGYAGRDPKTQMPRMPSVPETQRRPEAA